MPVVLTANDRERTTEFYKSVETGQPRQFLDFLIDHPDERFDSEALQNALRFPQHKDVALAAWSIGESAMVVGLARPWTEGQLGYLMTAETAAVLKQARSAIE